MGYTGLFDHLTFNLEAIQENGSKRNKYIDGPVLSTWLAQMVVKCQSITNPNYVMEWCSKDFRPDYCFPFV